MIWFYGFMVLAMAIGVAILAVFIVLLAEIIFDR